MYSGIGFWTLRVDDRDLKVGSRKSGSTTKQLRDSQARRTRKITSDESSCSGSRVVSAAVSSELSRIVEQSAGSAASSLS